jgi:hypothetical protein
MPERPTASAAFHSPTPNTANQDGEDDRREAQHRVDQAGADRVHPAAGISDHDAQQGAEDQADRDRRNPHGEGESGAVHHPAQDVAPEQIAAEPVLGGHRGEAPALAGGIPVVRRNLGRQCRQRQDCDQNDCSGLSTRGAEQPRDHTWTTRHACTRGSIRP